MTYKPVSSVFSAIIACIIAFAAIYAGILTISKIESDRLNANTLVVASHLSPLDEDNYLSLASITPSKEGYFLRKAVNTNPWDARTLVQLGLIYEADGDTQQAEQFLLDAARHDRRTETSWALINFYFRQNKIDHFFKWAARYRQFERIDTSGLFRLAWEMSPDVNTILSQFNPLSCNELVDFGQFLNHHPSISETPAVDKLLAQCQDPQAQRTIMMHASRLLTADQPGSALDVWNNLATTSGYTKLLPANGASVTNANFGIPFAENGFDWRINQTPNIRTKQLPQQHALEFAFNGEEPDGVTLLFQPIVFDGGHAYRMHCRITSDGTETTPGFRWRIVELSTGRSLPTALDDAPSVSGNTLTWEFQAPASQKTLALALAYFRPAGSTRFSGTARLSDVQLELK